MDMITNDHYYRALNIMDRIEEVRLEKKILKSEIGKKLGYSSAYYQVCYDNCRTLKVSTLIKFAKAVDISVEYFLTGKNKQEFKSFEFNLEVIKNTKIKYIPNSLKVIKCRMKKEKAKDITIKTLFEFEKLYRIPAIKLIGGE
jgi:transcriptional regulator with XRE-family HTH domain